MVYCLLAFQLLRSPLLLHLRAALVPLQFVSETLFASMKDYPEWRISSPRPLLTRVPLWSINLLVHLLRHRMPPR